MTPSLNRVSPHSDAPSTGLQDSNHDVLIVGAGPAGMMLAGMFHSSLDAIMTILHICIIVMGIN